MRLLISTLIILSLAVFASGCTSYGKFIISKNIPPATDPKHVRVYAIDKPKNSYWMLGYISLYNPLLLDGDGLKEELKVKGAEIGADAIINFKLNINIGEGGGEGGGAEGLAIKFK